MLEPAPPKGPDLAQGIDSVEYWQGKRRLAVATVNRDRAGLQAEAEMEAALQPANAP